MLNRLLTTERGAAVIEFAFTMPILAIFLFGILVYGQYYFLAHNIQQLANDGARAAVAGLTARERIDLATGTARMEATAALKLDPDRLEVSVSDAAEFTQVAIAYDASDSSLFRIGLFPTPDPVIRRTAAVRMGGL